MVPCCYRTQISPEIKIQQVNTKEHASKEIQKNTVNNPSPTNIKESPKVVKNDIIAPEENTLIITEKNFGQFYTPTKGQQVFLRLSNDFTWTETEQKTTGEIVLTRVNQNKNTGYREWQLNFPVSSTATIESNISTGTLGTDAEITKFFVTIKT